MPRKKRGENPGDEPEDDDENLVEEDEVEEHPVDRLARLLGDKLSARQSNPMLDIPEEDDNLDTPQTFDAGNQVYTHNGEHIGPGPVRITSASRLRDLHAAKQRYHRSLADSQEQIRQLGIAGHTQTAVNAPGPGGAANAVAGPDYGLGGIPTAGQLVPSVEYIQGAGGGNYPDERGFVQAPGGPDPHEDFLNKE